MAGVRGWCSSCWSPVVVPEPKGQAATDQLVDRLYMLRCRAAAEELDQMTDPTRAAVAVFAYLTGQHDAELKKVEVQ